MLTRLIQRTENVSEQPIEYEYDLTALDTGEQTK